MEKYTNAWFHKKTDPNHHDCANDGTCGQSITNFEIDNSDIFFYDSNGTVIAQIPKLPNGNSITYHNNLYKTAQSKNFGESTKVGLQDVLPNQFNFEHGKLNCVIHYDNVSQQEQEQMKLNIKWDQSLLNASGGITNGKSVLLYKNVYTDNVLAHEFGHVFQRKLSEEQVRKLDSVNDQLIANAIGLEVEEKNYKAICKQMGVDEYADRGWMFSFKYKGTTGRIYRIYRQDLSEEEKFQIIQRVKNSGLDEYKDRGSILSFKYKGTTGHIHRHDLSDDEKFQTIQNARKLCELVDEYKDFGSMFRFKYKGTTGSIYRNDLSEDEKFQIIQRVKNSGLDEYEDRESMFSFQYKGTNYNIQHKGYLSAEEEKLQFIKDIKNSHESLISERYRLNEGPLSQNATVVISIDENKEISQMYFHNSDKNISKWLDKTLISRSKPEQDVDEVDHTEGKEPEPGKEPKEDVSRSKPEQDVDEVDHTEGKEPEEDTQQPSNFLSNIFSTIKSIIDSISSLFSWLFGSKEEEQSDNNLSLLNLSEEQSDDNLSLLKPDVNHDADENYVDNYSLCNHDYHQHDDLI